MLEDLTPPQRRLAELMSELSEEAYYAAWAVGLEYALWEAVLDGRSEWGMLELTEEQRTQLRQLAEECAGWIVFDDQRQEVWLSTPDWQALFARWKQTRA
jgi:hypothetical protein